MKLKTFLIYALLMIGLCAAFSMIFMSMSKKEATDTASFESNQMASQYAKYLEEHPFRNTMSFSKEERKNLGLPPNKFYEQEWLYTSDPALLRPAPEKVHKLQEQLRNNPLMRTPPGTGTNTWVERGPNNVGGRTPTLMFAPGSTTKVFAGGVSCGLWVNDDITSGTTQWRRVSGVPSNLAVMCITVDPNDTHNSKI